MSRPTGAPRGRERGSKNVATVERELLAKRAVAAAASRKAVGQKLAREVLAEAMMKLWGLAEQFFAEGKLEAWREHMLASVDVAHKLIPYESPRLENVTVHKADPFAAMSNEQLVRELIAAGHKLGIDVRPPKLIQAIVSKGNGQASED